MFTKRNTFWVITFSLFIFLCFGSLKAARGEQIEKLSISGFGGTLKQIEVSAAISEIKKLKIGQPPFLKDLDTIEAYGINSCSGGVLQKRNEEVWVFKLTFQSEEQAISSLNLKKERQKGHATHGTLAPEDETNVRNHDFGLFFDGSNWSGYRRNGGVLAL